MTGKDCETRPENKKTEQDYKAILHVNKKTEQDYRARLNIKRQNETARQV